MQSFSNQCKTLIVLQYGVGKWAGRRKRCVWLSQRLVDWGLSLLLYSSLHADTPDLVPREVSLLVFL